MLFAAFFAALVAMLATLFAAPAAVTSVADPVQVSGAIHAFDVAAYDQAINYSTSERGPPIEIASHAHLSVDQGSSGNLARPRTAGTYAYTTYDTLAALVRVDNRTGTTSEHVQTSNAGLSSFERLQVAAETGGARFVAGSDGVTDLLGGAPDAVSLGHYPAYVDLGATSGARTFSMSDEAWNAMSSREQWVRNARFLDKAIARGSQIRLATSVDAARPGTFFERELQYMFKRGYTPSSDGTMLIPGSP